MSDAATVDAVGAAAINVFRSDSLESDVLVECECAGDAYVAMTRPGARRPRAKTAAEVLQILFTFSGRRVQSWSWVRE